MGSFPSVFWQLSDGMLTACRRQTGGPLEYSSGSLAESLPMEERAEGFSEEYIYSAFDASLKGSSRRDHQN